MNEEQIKNQKKRNHKLISLGGLFSVAQLEKIDGEDIPVNILLGLLIEAKESLGKKTKEEISLKFTLLITVEPTPT